MLQLDAVQTLALAGIALFLGYALCRAVPVLGRYNLPPPVIGGLVFAIAAWIAHDRGTTLFELDTGLQGPLMRSRLQSLSERRNRASVLSLHSLVFRLGFVATGPLVGWLADTRGLSATFFLLTGFFILALGLAGREFFRANSPDSLA